MTWQEKALTLLVEELVDKYVEGNIAFEKLSNAGIEIKRELASSTVDVPFLVLRGITNWESLSENLDAFYEKSISKEEIIQMILEHMQETIEENE